ncbi:MAG: SsrA-binding protein SmpB [candidate division WOR-3 bacterium]
MIKIIVENKKAKANYEIIEKYEAGIELKGSEVKSIKLGRVSLKDSFVIAKRNELFIINMYIAPYEFTSHEKIDPERPRKLLLHRKEIDRIIGKSKERGLTIIPIKIYQKNHLIKVEIALAKGLRKYEKKEKIKERILERELRRDLKKLR